MKDILGEMLNSACLPLIHADRRTHYAGSIDKQQRNYDCNWLLYEDEKHEFVLFEQYGAGCIFNFVQHRMPYADDPLFRFYFDGEEKPRFEIRHSQFGEKRPFTEPLAGAFAGPFLDAYGGTYIRVVRSFVPMPFKTHCKITCNIKLEDKHPGGWGHVIYQTFSEDKPLNSFDPNDPRLNELEALWAQKGKNPLRVKEGDVKRKIDCCLHAGETASVYERETGGMITSIKIRTREFEQSHLKNLWVRAVWDDHDKDDLYLPFGCLFGNELGHHGVSYLYLGMDAAGTYYCYLPMPFQNNAKLFIENLGETDVLFEEIRIEATNEFDCVLAQGEWGYMRNSHYHEKSCAGNNDSIIGEVTGERGKIIAAIVTGYPFEEGGRADCEGNVHLHFDGIRTPQILSDGSESYVCYGWGFCAPPQCNALTGYDGKRYFAHDDWSMCRLSPGEGYPFRKSFRFGIESFAYNNELMKHSGTILYYGIDKEDMRLVASYQTKEETLSACFEGDDDDKMVVFSGDRWREFTIDVPVAGMKSVILRRISDQSEPRQMATVYVDEEACEKPWYVPACNPYLRWLEDEYIIPSAYLRGKDTVTIHIVPKECGGKTAFNQFGIEIYACYHH